MIFTILEFVILIVLTVINIAITVMLVSVTNMDKLNGIFFAVPACAFFYCGNRFFETFWKFDMHIVFCLLIALAVYLGVVKAQENKIVFWILAILMSVVWAAPFYFIVSRFIDDKIWLSVATLVALGFNFLAHYRTGEANGVIRA